MSVRLFKSLLFKSTRIQREIESEQSRLWPDRWRLIKLKKIRLAIKDRMERLVHNAMMGAASPQLQKARIRKSTKQAVFHH